MTKEEMEIQIHQFAEMMYRTGYEDGQKDWHNVDEEREKAYKQGLNDAWEAARKIGDNSQFTLEKMGFEIQDPYKNASWDVVCEYSASEVIAKIKEYEENKQGPSVARACSILEDDCPYDIECEECEVHCSIERARKKLKESK